MSKNDLILLQLKNGVLTESDNVNSQSFKDFQLLIKSKVAAISKKDKIGLSILSLKYHMEDYLKSKKSNLKIGSFIKDLIERIEVKQVEFANFVGMRPSNFSKILSGKRRLNLELALIIERITNINAELWMAIQNKNEIFEMRKQRREKLKSYKLKELLK